VELDQQRRSAEETQQETQQHGDRSLSQSIQADAAADGAAERRLRESDERFQALAASAGQIAWTMTAAGMAADVRTWCAFTGQSQDAAWGLGWLRAVHPDDRQRVAGDCARSRSAPQSAGDLEYRVRRSDGVYRTVLSRGMPVLNADGSVREWVGICTDITEHKQQNQRLALHYAVSRMLAESTSLAPIRIQVLQTIAEALEWEYCAYWAVDEQREVLYCAATWQASGAMTAPFVAVSEQMTFATGIGLPGRVWSSGEPAWIPEVLADPSFLRKRAVEQARLRSAFAFPVRGASGIVGIIECLRSRPEAPDADLLRTVATLGNQIGLFIERRRLERQAAERARQKEAIFEAMVEGVVVYDAAGGIVEMNRAARQLLGVHAASGYESLALPERMARLRTRDPDGQPIPFERLLQVRALQGETLAAGEASDTIETTLDGREVQFSNSVAPLRDAQGRIAGAVLVFRDVTERKRRQREQMQRTQESLDALLQMAEALVVGPMGAELDGEGIQSSADEVARHLAKLTLRLLGCRCVGIIAVQLERAEARPLAVAGLSRVEEHEWRAAVPGTIALCQALDPELQMRLALEAVVPFDLRRLPVVGLPDVVVKRNWHLAPMRLGDQLVGVMALNYRRKGAQRELTPDELRLAGAVAKLGTLAIQRERLLREREEARASALALQEANRRMDEFLGIAAHEMRTPLTVIKSTVQFLARREQRTAGTADTGERSMGVLDRQRKLITRAERQVHRLVRLVDDLVDASRIREGRLDFRMERCNLFAIVRAAVEEQRQTNLSRPIRVHTSTMAAISVQADGERIGQVVTNYLTNASKYSLPDRPVEVGVELGERTARVWVRDQGLGIPAADQPHIWERFYRVEGIEVQTGSEVGIGLGLHISRTIIERHGGQVGVESAPGGGSTFWFTLPLAASSAG
jgi:PAS domain S-box-containing protein